MVNTIRQHWFSWYQEMALFLDATECFAVQDFFLDCTRCQDGYRGVTLPRDFQAVEAMWLNSFPIRLHSSWREFQIGLSPECDCRLQKFDLPGGFCTALDITARAPKKMRVMAVEKKDAGKRFVLRGTDAVLRPFSQEFSLSTFPQETEMQLSAIQPAGGVVKDRTEGPVFLLDEDNRLISRYEPDETVPTYKRIKITGLPDDCQAVNIRAARRYFPLYNDDDVVESDNAAAFDAMARYLRLYEKSDKTREDLAGAALHLQTAVKLMMGDKARELGQATQASVTIQTPSFGGRRLNRLGRRF